MALDYPTVSQLRRHHPAWRLRAEILKRNLPFSISEIEEACPGVSRDMVRLVLRAMKTEGLIAPTGKGCGAKWIGLGQRPPTQQ